MSDIGSRYTDRQIAEIEKRIKKIYKEAKQDIQRKMDNFLERHKAKDAIYQQQFDEGKITYDDYADWLAGQLFQSKQWRAKKNQITETLYHANDLAVQIVNGKMTDVFSFNANFMNYNLEHGEGVNFGFGIYDSATVVNLIKNDPDLLPPRKLNKQKDKTWNRRNITAQITQGIIQGEKLDEIADRIADVTASRNHNAMLTTARTVMTGAQNAGRQISLNNAKTRGIDVKKEWMCTLDGRTRDTHRELDGKSVDIRSPFKVGSLTIMYPGDPKAHPSLVYNCRCTLVGDVVGYPSEYQRYDNIDGKPIKNMTYNEWFNAKNGITQIQSFQSMLGAAKTVKEVNDLMNSQGWFRKISDWGDGIYSQADLNGCDLESAKSIAASYEQVFEKYPKLKGQFDAPDAHPKNMKDNTYAWCFMQNDGKVQVNPHPSRFGNWSGIVNSYERDVVNGWHPKGTTAESIVTHELGHAIDGLLARKGIKGGLTASGQYRYASSTLRNTIMKRAAKKDPVIQQIFDIWGGKEGLEMAVHDYVSQYATKNPQEWFAECFAEYITSANPRLVSKVFGEELERLLDKL